MTAPLTMFIGSSAEAKDVAEYLQAALQGHCEADVWDQHIFEPTGEVLGRLLVAAEGYDFATLVLSADDVVERRGVSALEPRGNVTLELGLFLGALGRQRVFMLASSRLKPRLPSDLHEISLIEYHERGNRNLRAEVNPAALRIREHMRVIGPRKKTARGVDRRDPIRFASDLVTGLRDGTAGLRVQLGDESAQATWSGNALGMLTQLFMDRATDVYVVWLRPDESGRLLVPALSRNLPDGYPHYPFRLDEGFAGKLWARGVAAAHSRGQPHEWWVYREGCDNQTYIGSAVGPAGAAGGVLGVGSDLGFTVADGDVEVVQLFASIIAASLVAGTGDVRRARLADHALVLDRSLAAYPVTRQARPGEIKVRNCLVELAQDLLSENPIVMGLEVMDTAADVECGELRMDVAQVLAALKLPTWSR